ncbi:MAG: hypothetical protein V1780_06175 [Chloroflexota bacterium]
MLRLKSCPRCNGDIRLDRDQYGWYEECIQCGYVRDLKKVVTAPEGTEEKKGAGSGHWHGS